DLEVALAGRTHRELVRAIAGEDRVGMAIDEARREQPAVHIDVGIEVLRGTVRADRRDRPVDDRDRAALDDAEPRQRWIAGHHARVVEQRRRHRSLPRLKLPVERATSSCAAASSPAATASATFAAAAPVSVRTWRPRNLIRTLSRATWMSNRSGTRR